MSPQTESLVFCVLVTFVIHTQGLQFSMDTALSSDSLRCSFEKNRGDDKMTFVTYVKNLTVYDVTQSNNPIKLASLSVNDDLCLIKHDINGIIVSGKISISEAEMTLDLINSNHCLYGSFMCALEFENSNRQTEVISRTLSPGDSRNCHTTEKEKHVKLEAKVVELEKENIKLKNKIAELESENGKLKKQALDQEKENDKLKKQTLDQERENDKLKKQALDQEKENDQLKKQALDQEKENDKLKKQTLDQEKENDKLKKQVLDQGKENDKLKKQAVDQEKENDKLKKQALDQKKENDQILKQVLDQEKENDKLRKQALDQEKENIKNKNKVVELEREYITHEKIVKLETEYITLENKVGEHENEIVKLKKQALDLEKENDRLKKQVDEIEKENVKCVKEISYIKQQNMDLKTTVARLEDVFNLTIDKIQTQHDSPSPIPRYSKFQRKVTTCVKGMTQKNSRERVLLWDKVPALCDTETDGGGWIVIQRRTKGDVDFYRPWKDYKNGFGTPETDFWLGNDVIHNLTSQGYTELRVDMEYQGRQYFAHYSHFHVADETSLYRLSVSGYSGTAGNGLSRHNGRSFSTFDKDNDIDSGNCASKWHGAWWYGDCHDSNLNGRWGAQDYSGVGWRGVIHLGSVSLSEMKIRRGLNN